MNFANKISTFRILSVPFFIASLYYSSGRESLRAVALVIFIIAVFSDAIDGYIARKTQQKSQAGLVLDPLADKLLLVSAFICLYMLGEFPFWVILVVITRDVIITLGAVVIYMVKHNLNISSSISGKIATLAQMSTIIATLLRLQFLHIFWWITVILTIISGIIYVMKGFKILYAADNSRNNS
ncbi:CDP-diacylglycerol--glycerol-3-phosphate 3-phosphatidyltransferase [bacterium]|nr:MAG: CDP-diacylglycerol--glycerol-3-phosphate 3-phosphatidyltransferase [bacterium]